MLKRERVFPVETQALFCCVVYYFFALRSHCAFRKAWLRMCDTSQLKRESSGAKKYWKSQDVQGHKIAQKLRRLTWLVKVINSFSIYCVSFSLMWWAVIQKPYETSFRVLLALCVDRDHYYAASYLPMKCLAQFTPVCHCAGRTRSDFRVTEVLARNASMSAPTGTQRTALSLWNRAGGWNKFHIVCFGAASFYLFRCSGVFLFLAYRGRACVWRF